MLLNNICFLTILFLSLQLKAVCVTSKTVQLRAAPNKKAAVTWQVGKYMPLKKISEKSGWLQVEDVDGERHWVQKSAVSEKIVCAVVKSTQATLRQRPSGSAPAIESGAVDKYTPFKRVGREDSWVQLEDEYKTRSWANEKLLWWPVTRSSVHF